MSDEDRRQWLDIIKRAVGKREKTQQP
jgi:gluconate kinase